MANKPINSEETRDRVSVVEPISAKSIALEAVGLESTVDLTELEGTEPVGLGSTDLEPTGFEPELGGYLRDGPERTGLEPELGGIVRQNGVYVDETTCIGCQHCAHVARNTFYVNPEYGRARVIQQDGDPEDIIEEAIDTCPVDCIHWVDYTQLKQLEQKRKNQVVKPLGFPQPSVKLK